MLKKSIYWQILYKLVWAGGDAFTREGEWSETWQSPKNGNCLCLGMALSSTPTSALQDWSCNRSSCLEEGGFAKEFDPHSWHIHFKNAEGTMQDGREEQIIRTSVSMLDPKEHTGSKLKLLGWHSHPNAEDWRSWPFPYSFWPVWSFISRVLPKVYSEPPA